MPTTTPALPLSPEVRAFCATISKEEPVIVPVLPTETARTGFCFPNVKAMAASAGGELVTGWIIWTNRNVFAEAEHHAVWRMSADYKEKMPSGGLLPEDVRTMLADDMIDVTPKADGEGIIVFLPDPAATLPVNDGFPRPMARVNRRAALVDDPIVKRFVETSDAVAPLERKRRGFGVLDKQGDKMRLAKFAKKQANAARAFFAKYP